jgi:hypothetical protein
VITDTMALLEHIRDAYPMEWPQLTEAQILRAFYVDVCAEAEKIMAQTNTVSGAHWNAMKRVLAAKGIEV